MEAVFLMATGGLLAAIAFAISTRSERWAHSVLSALELAVGDEIRIGRQWRAIRALLVRDNGVLLFLDNFASGDFYNGNIQFNVRRTK